MTIKDIIKVLPIEEKRKMQILNTYDYMEVDERVMIDRAAWSAFYEMYNGRLEDNLSEQTEKVKNGEEAIGDDFYTRALKKADQSMNGELQESAGKFDLAAARVAMQQIVQEIRASKADKKAAYAAKMAANNQAKPQ